MMAALEPWVLFRLVAGLVAACLLAHAAWVGARVIRFFHLRTATEGQLALERQAELGATSARVGALVSAMALVLSVAAAERLTPTLRGAMCGYGVVNANPFGPLAMTTSVLAALSSGILLSLLSLDGKLKGLSLVRPLAIMSMVVAAVSVLDLSFSAQWLLGLDRTVVASCCSSGVDAGTSAAAAATHAEGPRRLVTGLAVGISIAAAVTAFVTARAPRRAATLVAGGLSALLLPVAAFAIILEVAPHVLEVPHHRCPYCLFRADSWWIGYPLFGSVFLTTVFGVGAALSAALTPRDEEEAFTSFARRALGREAVLSLVALALGALPVVRYAIVSGGASLFR